MRLSTGLLLPTLIGAVSAASDAKVYLFQGDEWPNTSNPPTLSPKEARLVFAQRLGVSQYHSLNDVGEDTLSYINQFGGPQEQLFGGNGQGKAPELVLLVEGVSAEQAEPLLSAWSSIQPAFTISNPPSSSENLELAFNLDRQLGPDVQACPFEQDIDPDNRKCWKGRSKILQIDLTSKRPGLSKMLLAQERLVDFAKHQKMNVMVVLMPESSWSTKSTNAYGSYEKPSQKQLDRRVEAEEPISEVHTASSPVSHGSQLMPSVSSEESEPIRGIPSLCYNTLESCMTSTNKCSGHGECYKKSNGTDATAACFSCQCKPQFEYFFAGKNRVNSSRTTYWGGAACQKKDVSGPFWLFATFTVVMIGLVGWAIGLLFNVGEEKLPGVIGAGVSSKAR